jgi:hypothetical protein
VADRKVQVPYNGKTVTGTVIEVDETIERASEIRLADGTRLRLKSAVITAIRIDGEYTPEGDPVYVLNAAPVMTIIEAPANLKKKKK